MRELQFNKSKADQTINTKLSENDRLNEYLKIKQQLEKAQQQIQDLQRENQELSSLVFGSQLNKRSENEIPVSQSTPQSKVSAFNSNSQS